MAGGCVEKADGNKYDEEYQQNNGSLWEVAKEEQKNIYFDSLMIINSVYRLRKFIIIS